MASSEPRQLFAIVVAFIPFQEWARSEVSFFTSRPHRRDVTSASGLHSLPPRYVFPSPIWPPTRPSFHVFSSFSCDLPHHFFDLPQDESGGPPETRSFRGRNFPISSKILFLRGAREKSGFRLTAIFLRPDPPSLLKILNFTLRYFFNGRFSYCPYFLSLMVPLLPF